MLVERERPAPLPHTSLESMKKFLSVCRKIGCHFFHSACLLLHSAVTTWCPVAQQKLFGTSRISRILSLVSSFPLIMIFWMTQAQRERRYKHTGWRRRRLTTAGCGGGLFLLKWNILQGAGGSRHLGRPWCLFALLLIPSYTFLRFFLCGRFTWLVQQGAELFPKFLLSVHLLFAVRDARVHILLSSYPIQ